MVVVTTVFLCITLQLHASVCWWSVVCVDVAGPAAVTGPHAVIVGDNATLNCSVADPGCYLHLISAFLRNLLHLHVNCSSVTKIDTNLFH